MSAIADEQAPTGQPEPPAGPVPFLAGKFALFQTPDGGVLLCYKPNGAEHDERHHLPGPMVAFMNHMQDTGQMPSPMDMFKIYRQLRGH